MKIVELCGKCAALLGEHYNVKRIAGGRDRKVTCEQCGCRRYGGTYEIGRVPMNICKKRYWGVAVGLCF